MGRNPENDPGMGDDGGAASTGPSDARGILLSDLEAFQAQAEQRRAELQRAKFAAENRRAEAEKQIEASRGVLEALGRRWVEAYQALESEGAITPPAPARSSRPAGKAEVSQ